VPLQTYQEFPVGTQKGGTIREDLLDVITNLSPRDTPLFNNLGSVQVDAGYVEILTDTLNAAAVNAWVEGAAATDVNLSVPSRSAAIVQTFMDHFWVSGRQRSVTHAGMADPMAYQELKNTKEFRTDIELALHRGSAVTGDSDTAAQTAGFLNAASTNNTSSSGTTLTESVFNDLLQLAYSYNMNLREVYCNMFLKRTINGYTTDTTRFISADARRQVDIVDAYESEIGILALFKSRYQLQSASKTTQGNSFIAIDPDHWKVGWLRAPQTFELGKDGDRDRRMIVGELALLPMHETAAVVGQGYVPYLP
jgi:hypothetical protein